MKDEDLAKFFELFAPSKVDVRYNKKGVSMQTAQVHFHTRRERQAALKALTGNISVNGCIISIKPAH
jgi:RNA recognition motif-containing protein